MTANERRLAQRFDLRIPLSVRAPKSAAPEHRTESLNVSARGIYFATNLPLREGMPVQVTFEMPEEITHKPAAEWRCTGHVVHVEPSNSRQSSQQSMIRVGVGFDCYEVL
jgi:hypothetical protein